MKKIFTLTIIAFTLLACEPTPTAVVPGVYPTDSLVVLNDQKAFVLETTGTWCQYCPNGAAAMLEMQTTYNEPSNIKVIGFASHSGDPLVTPVQDLLNTTFPTTGVPNFYVNNADVGQSISDPVASALSATAPVGVSHVSSQVGDSMIVDIKVKFFEDKKNIAYYVQSYVLVTEIDAKEYDLGGLPVDLNQVSSVSIVTTGSGSTPTKWAVDTWGKKAGDIYTHDHIPFTSGNTPFEWGVTLDTINPLGQAYFEGDIFGSKYTPIQIKIPLSIQGMALPPDLKYEVVTIIWSERFDGSPGVLFVNGFQG